VLGSLCRELFLGASEGHGGRYGELHQLALRWVAAGWAAAVGGTAQQVKPLAREQAPLNGLQRAGPSGKSLLHPSRWYCHLQ